MLLFVTRKTGTDWNNIRQSVCMRLVWSVSIKTNASIKLNTNFRDMGKQRRGGGRLGFPGRKVSTNNGLKWPMLFPALNFPMTWKVAKLNRLCKQCSLIVDKVCESVAKLRWHLDQRNICFAYFLYWFDRILDYSRTKSVTCMSKIAIIFFIKRIHQFFRILLEYLNVRQKVEWYKGDCQKILRSIDKTKFHLKYNTFIQTNKSGYSTLLVKIFIE